MEFYGAASFSLFRLRYPHIVADFVSPDIPSCREGDIYGLCTPECEDK